MFDALLRFVKNTPAIRGLRPFRLKGTQKDRFQDKLVLSNGMYCYWCDSKLNNKTNDPKCNSLDHVIPRQFGGPNHIDNVVLACRECDTGRSRETPVEPVLKYFGINLEDLKEYL